MDGEDNEKHYFLMDDLGGPPLFLETPIYIYIKWDQVPPKLFRIWTSHSFT